MYPEIHRGSEKKEIATSQDNAESTKKNLPAGQDS